MYKKVVYSFMVIESSQSVLSIIYYKKHWKKMQETVWEKKVNALLLSLIWYKINKCFLYLYREKSMQKGTGKEA